jgi:hypothetical protein
MSGLVRDPDTGELVGPVDALEAALAGAADREAGDLEPALAAARDPAFRVWIEGVEPGLTLLAGRAACAVLTGRPGGQRALAGVSLENAPVVLLAWLGLGPRPVPDDPAVRLDPGAMAVLIARGEVHGHGLPDDQAAALQARLDLGVRHWSVRLETGARRRHVEVVEGEGGIWHVRTTDDGLVELAPTTTTEVVRAIVALVQSGAPADAAA